jgi:MYND finger
VTPRSHVKSSCTTGHGYEGVCGRRDIATDLCKLLVSRLYEQNVPRHGHYSLFVDAPVRIGQIRKTTPWGRARSSLPPPPPPQSHLTSIATSFNRPTSCPPFPCLLSSTMLGDESSNHSTEAVHPYDSAKTLKLWGFTESCCRKCQVSNSKIGGKLMQCGKCRKAYYCSKACFNSDLKAHQMFCKTTAL